MTEDAKFLKRIRVKNLNINSNIPELAKKIVESCKLISESKLLQVEHLLQYLLKRKEASDTNTRIPALCEKLADPGAFGSTEIDEVAHLTDVDEYLELLYEDIPEKLRASTLLLQLARNPDNLEELFQNETLVGALSRVLREDWKKSNDLATNIIYIFFCFSAFTNFHGVILHFKIGALTMNIVEHEIKTFDLWTEELARKRVQVKPKHEGQYDNLIGSKTGETIQEGLEITEMKYKTLVQKQEQLFRVAFYLLLNISEDLSVEMKMHNKGIVQLICGCLERNNYELLILLVSFLKKLSIFAENKEEMLKHNIMDRLSMILARPESEIINMSLRLLFNLSFDAKARKEMVSKGFIQTLTEFLDNEIQRPVTLFLLYHLSTEDESKKSFIQDNCIPSLMKLLMESQDAPKDLITMALLINLACVPECAAVIGEGRYFRGLVKQGIRRQDTLVMKLIRNLTMTDYNMKMALVEYLPALVKVVTNWEVNLKIPPTGPRSAEDLNLSGIECTDGDHELECLGCLANLSITDVDFTRVLRELRLLDWIQRCLTQLCMVGEEVDENRGNPFKHSHTSRHATGPVAFSPRNCYPMHPEDDVVLEVVRLVGTICLDPAAAQVIMEAKLVEKLIVLLNLKQEDDEIVCQIVNVFYQLSFNSNTRDSLVKYTQVPAYLIDLMHDKNNEIRRLCDASLDIISEHDPTWGAKILTDKFRWHNNQWLEMIEPPITSPPTGALQNVAAIPVGCPRAQHHRQQHNRKGVVPPSNSPPGGQYEGYGDGQSDEETSTAGLFGPGVGISDAAAFLMSLQTGRYNSSENDRQIPYLNHLEMLYPELYSGANVIADDGFIPAFGDASQFSSTSETSSQKCNSP